MDHILSLEVDWHSGDLWCSRETEVGYMPEFQLNQKICLPLTGLKAWPAQKRDENVRHMSFESEVSSVVSDNHLIVFHTKLRDFSLGVH